LLTSLEVRREQLLDRAADHGFHPQRMMTVTSDPFTVLRTANGATGRSVPPSGVTEGPARQ
jgi:hypothetical protein